MFMVRSHTRSPERSLTRALVLSELGAPKLHTQTLSSVRTGPRSLLLPSPNVRDPWRFDDCTGTGVGLEWVVAEEFTSGADNRANSVEGPTLLRLLSTAVYNGCEGIRAKGRLSTWLDWDALKENNDILVLYIASNVQYMYIYLTYWYNAWAMNSVLLYKIY